MAVEEKPLTSDVVQEQHTAEFYNLYYSVILFNAVVAAERITVRRRRRRRLFHSTSRRPSTRDASWQPLRRRHMRWVVYPFTLLYINDYQETIVCVL